MTIKNCSALRWAVRAALCVPSTMALAGPQYIVTDLSALNGTHAEAHAVNGAGKVAGFGLPAGSGAQNAFFETVGQPVLNIGSLGGSNSIALDINNSDLLVGSANLAGDTSSHAFISQSGGAPQDLGAFPGGNASRASAINDAGQVVGAAATDPVTEHGFLWQSGGALKDIGTLGGANSVANDINASGQITGYSDVAASKAQHAFLYQAGAMTDLKTLGGSFSEGNAINASAVVVGHSTLLGDTAEHAFLAKPGAAMVDLGTLGGTFSEAVAVNTDGDVVGSATTRADANLRAFVWRNGTMTDLNSVILTGTPWTLIAARSINDGGQIVGYGDYTDPATLTLQRRAFLLTPDKTAPTITCPASVTTAGAQPASIGQATATDNLSGTADIVVTSSPALPFTFPNGKTTVTWTAQDAAGNTSSCSQLVTVGGDTTPPIVTAAWTSNGFPATPNGLGWYSKLPLTLTWTTADAESAITSTSGCGAITFTADSAATAPQTCLATSAGGPTSVTASVKVDATAPSLTAAATLVNADATNLAGATVTYTLPTLADSLSGPDSASVRCTPASGSTFTLGNNTVQCNGSDLAGNIGSTSFTVAVRDPSPPEVTPTLTGPAGSNGWYTGATSVTWTVTDGQSPVTTATGCDPTRFATDGANQSVTCSATSSGGTTPVTATVNIDSTPPDLGISATTLVVEASGPTGAMVIYPRTLSDATSGPATRSASCAPASNTTMPLGPTSVSCTGADLAGNTATGSFAISVVDTTAPSLTVPTGVAVSTADGAGATVSYIVSASDLVDGSVTPSCLPASGSLFGLGTTTVSCTAGDAHGNTVTKSFPVTVSLISTTPSDTIAPALSLPSGITVTAPNSAGAVVTYNASATDAVDGPVPLSCSKASGSLFTVGNTVVTCTAADLAGNVATGNFTVTVNPPVSTLPAADLALSVTESTGKRQAQINQKFSYQFTARNNGPQTAQTVKFSDLIPTNLRIVQVSPSTGTCTAPINSNGGTVACNFGNLASGRSAQVKITVASQVSSGTIANTGSVSGSVNDVNPDNNQAGITMTAPP
ncbi:MAG: HYR domain-containing protein [Methylococcaceae bacterium]|nr:HYR domain-containing protein [Methylococcaceae bacterium]